MKRDCILFACFLLFNLTAAAQTVPPATIQPVYNSFSLMGWDDAQRTALFDRRGARYGYVTDRGVFQRFTSRMTDEFDLNMFTFGFTPQQDLLWYRNENGYRGFAGKLNDLELALYSQYKTEALITPQTRFGVRVTAAQDARLNRTFAQLNLDRQISKNQYVQVFHTLSAYQQDLDAGIAYRYGHPQTGFFKVEIAALDYLNNLKIETINDDLTGADTLRRYRRSPYFASISASTPLKEGFRGEFFAGMQLESEAEISSASVRNFRYRHIENANYHGGMIEYRKESVSGLLFYSMEQSLSRIDTLQPSNVFSRYTSRQLQRSIGGTVQLTSTEFVLESTVVHMLQRDTQQGQNFLASFTYQDSLRFRATRYLTRNRVMRRPNYRGFTGGIEHTGDFRAPGNDAVRMRFWSNSLHDVNHRATLLLGWQFNPRAWVLYGYSLDLDRDYHLGDRASFYDGGFVRMEFRW
jgi:hypothetical protein